MNVLLIIVEHCVSFCEKQKRERDRDRDKDIKKTLMRLSDRLRRPNGIRD